jgi:eukaryotic-like serine/threonine-protein kinase
VLSGGFSGTDRFEVRRRLGEGGMGIVYEAFDRERSSVVALKTIRRMDAQGLYRLKQEFRALADLQHDNLISLHELICDGDLWFFTMELVAGQDFLSFVRHAKPADGAVSPSADTLEAPFPTASAPAPGSARQADEKRLRAALGQLARGLVALHTADKVHRDVKPTNVLVEDQGRVVLLDFGLIASCSVASHSSEHHVVGTAAYMAPEQAASKRVGPEADWYSVGVMLYEALTGRLPFVGAPLQMLMDKQRFEPPPPRALVAEVPRDLDALCSDLLRFEPRERPPTREILARLGVPTGCAAPLVRTSSSPAAQLVPFVGRERELAALREALDTVRRGRPVTVSVRADSGLGKSTLVRRFLDEVRRSDATALVLASRCYERESVPYKAFDGVVDAFSRHLATIDPLEAAHLLPRDAVVLGRVFPVLQRIPALARVARPVAAIHDPHELRTRAFAALREMLARCAERRTTIVFIDDLQWADIDSLSLIAEVLRPPAAPQVLVVFTVRSDAIVHDRVGGIVTGLREQIGDVTELPLDRLSSDDAHELAVALLRAAGRSPSEAPSIVDEARGHPLFIHELVRHATIVGGSASVRLKLDDALWARVCQLDPAARQLLEIIAVAETPIPQGIATRAAELATGAAPKTLALLKVATLVRTTGARNDDHVECYHDRVRESVLTRLDPALLVAHHRRLAEVIVGSDEANHDPRALVRHLEAAGERERSAAYAKRSARLASEALAFDLAAELYATALRLHTEDESDARAVRLALAEALSGAGRAAEAAEVFLAAADGADAATALTCRQRAAQHFLESGHIERGLDMLAQVLASIGQQLPATPRQALLGLILARARLRLRGITWTPREESDIPASDLVRLDVYRSAAQGLGMVDNIRATLFNSRCLRLALRVGDRRRVMRAIGFESVFVALQGHKSRSRAEALAGVLERIAAERADPEGQFYVMGASGTTDYFMGRFRAGSVRLQEAERFLLAHDEIRDTWLLSTLRIFMLQCMRHCGLFHEIGKRRNDYLREAMHRGDRYTSATIVRSQYVVHLADDAPDAVDRDLQAMPWTTQAGAFHMQHWYELRAIAEVGLYREQADRTLDVVDRMFPALFRSLITRIQIARAEALWLRARLLLSTTRSDAPALLREVRRLARLLTREATPYARIWAALTGGGLYYRSDRDRSVTHLRTAVALADEDGLNIYSAVARRQLGIVVGGSEGAALVTDADAAMTALGVRSPAKMTAVIAPVPGLS